jgi:hypothetical protein
MNGMYVNKTQLKLAMFGLIALVENDKIYDNLINKGMIEPEDISIYLQTLNKVIEGMGKDEGILVFSEIDLDTLESCHDLWGNPINDIIL